MIITFVPSFVIFCSVAGHAGAGADPQWSVGESSPHSHSRSTGNLDSLINLALF